jgi:hypothetical protein
MFAKYKQSFINTAEITTFSRDGDAATVTFRGSSGTYPLSKGEAEAVAKVLREQIKRDQAEFVGGTPDAGVPADETAD